MIDWDKEQCTEPPLTLGLPMHLLQQQARTGEGLNIPDIPSHAQAVERTVKLVTKTSGKVMSHAARHREILLHLFKKRNGIPTKKGSKRAPKIPTWNTSKRATKKSLKGKK